MTGCTFSFIGRIPNWWMIQRKGRMRKKTKRKMKKEEAKARGKDALTNKVTAWVDHEKKWKVKKSFRMEGRHFDPMSFVLILAILVPFLLPSRSYLVEYGECSKLFEAINYCRRRSSSDVSQLSTYSDSSNKVPPTLTWTTIIQCRYVRRIHRSNHWSSFKTRNWICIKNIKSIPCFTIINSNQLFKSGRERIQEKEDDKLSSWFHNLGWEWVEKKFKSRKSRRNSCRRHCFAGDCWTVSKSWNGGWWFGKNVCFRFDDTGSRWVSRNARYQYLNAIFDPRK